MKVYENGQTVENQKQKLTAVLKQVYEIRYIIENFSMLLLQTWWLY